jgi:hypothetical protein
MAKSKGEKAPDPLGKRALFSNVGFESDVVSTNVVSTNAESSVAERGRFTVECQRCRRRSHIGLLHLLIFQLPLGAWIPRGRFDHRMTCPSCRKRAWCSVTLRRD